MEFLIEAMRQSVGTVSLTCALCAVGIFAIIHTLGHQVLGTLLYPFSVATSLCASKFFVDNHFYAQRAFDKWVLFTIISCAIGMGLSLITYIALSRLMELRRPSLKPTDLNDLRVRRIQLEASRQS